MNTISLNWLGLESILARKFCFSVDIWIGSFNTARDINVPKFTLQNRIWLILILELLEAKRVNKTYDGAEIKNIYERLCLYFYLDEPDPRYIYNFVKLFEVLFRWK